MVGCWAIWEHRNKVVFDGIEAAPDSVVTRAMDVLSEMTMMDGGSYVRGKGGGRMEAQGGSEGWQSAPSGYVKLNVDAGVVEGEGSDTGVVCRGGDGSVLWGIAIGRKQQWEPVIAEAVAMLDGLQEALARGHRHVVIESDCLQVVDAVKEKRQVRSIFSLIVDDII
ncbi:uncharacterized protein LOC141655057 [Silene latifolia]|uniref:uncharacterized protein LOC141655057 n=1 Tax=Silene latifolia TaxID=37657 RepID=UPI003D780980